MEKNKASKTNTSKEKGDSASDTSDANHPTKPETSKVVPPKKLKGVHY